MIRHLLFAAAVGAASALVRPAVAQSDHPTDGRWTGTFAGRSQDMNVEMTIAGTEGTWRVTGRASQGRGNPCLGRAFPAKIEAQSASEFKVSIDASSVLAGCADASATLTLTAPDTLEGTLGNGQEIRLTRR